MKRTIRVVAYNGDTRIETVSKITVRPGCLVRSEVEHLAARTAAAIADGVRNLPYTNFGPENTVVKL